MHKRIYVVTDLGPGDGGKGSIVHALSRKIDASVIIKRGGAQGSHGVRTSRGESFNFSQWGCATLEGVPTFLSSQMVISPVGLENESDALKRLGIYDPYQMISADPDCICATPFHKIASQLEELLRKENSRGTVGTGVGQAYRMSEQQGESITIRAHELQNSETVTLKLSKQLDYYRTKYAGLTTEAVLPEDVELFNKNYDLLYSDGYLQVVEEIFANVGRKLRINELCNVVKDVSSAAVECSHGVLTDAEMGLQPHTSAIRTLPRFTSEMLRKSGYDGEIINLGVHRAYEVRHGAGPMPTYDEAFTQSMLPGSHKETNRWQGEIRAGALDLNLLNYAIKACGSTAFDGIALTWFDQILANNRIWPICTHYANQPSADETCTDFLFRAEPVLEELRIKQPIWHSDLFWLVSDKLEQTIGIPLSILSVGATENMKIFKEGFTHE